MLKAYSEIRKHLPFFETDQFSRISFEKRQIITHNFNECLKNLKELSSLEIVDLCGIGKKTGLISDNDMLMKIIIRSNPSLFTSDTFSNLILDKYYHSFKNNIDLFIEDANGHEIYNNSKLIQHIVNYYILKDIKTYSKVENYESVISNMHIDDDLLYLLIENTNGSAVKSTKEKDILWIMDFLSYVQNKSLQGEPLNVDISDVTILNMIKKIITNASLIKSMSLKNTSSFDETVLIKSIGSLFYVPYKTLKRSNLKTINTICSLWEFMFDYKSAMDEAESDSEFYKQEIKNKYQSLVNPIIEEIINQVVLGEYRSSNKAGRITTQPLHSSFTYENTVLLESTEQFMVGSNWKKNFEEFKDIEETVTRLKKYYKLKHNNKTIV